MKFYPYKKGGGRKSFSHPEGLGGGGAHKVLGVVLTPELEVLTILEGGTNGFHPLKGGGGGKGFTLS